MNVSALPQDVRDYIADLEARLTSVEGRWEAKLASVESNWEKKMRILQEQHQLELLRRFGRSADWIDPAQISLFDPESGSSSAPEEAEETVPVPGHRRKRPGRKAIPESIPRETVVVDIAEGEKLCGCGEELTKIGEEVSERLEIIPARIFVKRFVRPRYACGACEGSGDEERPAVRVAPAVPAIIPGSIAGASLLATVFIDKFADHLPYYRQEARFARIGVDVSRQNMATWQQKVFEAVRPLVELTKEHLRTGRVLQMDETTLQVMQEEGRENHQKSYMWLARGGPPDRPAVIYEYRETRGSRHIHGFLEGFTGFLQTDGYEGYGAALKDHPGIVHVGCFAHARRKFVEASKLAKKPGSAEQGVAFIAKLYRIESRLRAKDLPDEEFLEERREASEPVLEKFRAWLEKQTRHVPPSSRIGTAISYTLKQWSRLIQYLECAELTPDNNAAERAIKPFVIGRKNWLFSGSPKGADSSCALYSLIETAKANGLNPHEYLRHVFDRAPFARSRRDWVALLAWNVDLNSPQGT